MKTALVLISIFISVQLAAQTTQEEYNYLTKGYKEQIEKGLDMKKGYSFKDLGTFEYKSGIELRRSEFKALMKEGDSKYRAILLIYRRVGADPYYVCIPTPDAPEDIWNQTQYFMTVTFANNYLAAQALFYSLTKLSAQEASK